MGSTPKQPLPRFSLCAFGCDFAVLAMEYVSNRNHLSQTGEESMLMVIYRKFVRVQKFDTDLPLLKLACLVG